MPSAPLETALWAVLPNDHQESRSTYAKQTFANISISAAIQLLETASTTSAPAMPVAEENHKPLLSELMNE